MIGFLIFVVAVLAIIGFRSRVVVPPDSAYVVERLGRYRATLQPGTHFLAPFLDVIRFRHSLAERTEELAESYTTSDGQRIQMTSAFRSRVLDPRRASYETADYAQFVRELVRNAQKRLVEARTWQSLREERRSFQQEVLREVNAAAENAGVKVTEHEVRDLGRQG